MAQWFGTRLYVALDATGVSAAAVDAGVGGHRLRSFHRVPLGASVVAPSASVPNLLAGDEVRRAIRGAAEGVAAATSHATLVLPDGIARFVLVDVPPGAEGRDFARFRVAAPLGWAGEASVELLDAGRGRAVGAAARRATLAEYEQAARDAGLEVDHVYLAPLLALAGLLRTGRRDVVHVVLGDVALCLVGFRGGELAAIRSRRRDLSAGEAARVVEEAVRTATLAGDGSAPRTIAVSGSGALVLRQQMGPATAVEPGLRAPGGWPEAVEAAWLAGVLG